MYANLILPDSLIIVDDVSLSLATTGSIVNINSNFSSQFLTTLVTFAIFTLDAGYYYCSSWWTRKSPPASALRYTLYAHSAL